MRRSTREKGAWTAAQRSLHGTVGSRHPAAVRPSQTSWNAPPGRRSSPISRRAARGAGRSRIREPAVTPPGTTTRARSRPAGRSTTRSASSPAAASSASTPGAAELGRRSRCASPRRPRTRRRGRGRRRAPAGRASTRSRISIHSCSASQTRDVLERVGLEVGAELAVEDAQHVAVELRRHARRVVVAPRPAGRVLDQVGAEQQRVARREGGARRRRRNRRAGAGSRLPIVDAEERHAAGGGRRGSSSRCALEVADHRVDVDAGVARRRWPRWPPAAPTGSTSNGHEAAQRARVAQRVEQQPGLLRGARCRARPASRRRWPRRSRRPAPSRIARSARVG